MLNRSGKGEFSRPKPPFRPAGQTSIPDAMRISPASHQRKEDGGCSCSPKKTSRARMLLGQSLTLSEVNFQHTFPAKVTTKASTKSPVKEESQAHSMFHNTTLIRRSLSNSPQKQHKPSGKHFSPSKRVWPLRMSQREIFSALTPQLFAEIPRKQPHPDAERLYLAYLSLLAASTTGLVEDDVKMTQGGAWKALIKLSRTPGRLIAGSKAVLKELQTNPAAGDKLKWVLEDIRMVLDGKVPDEQLCAVLSSFLSLAISHNGRSLTSESRRDLSLSSLSTSPQKASLCKPALRSARSNLTSQSLPRRSHTPEAVSIDSERVAPNPRLETLFCLFLKNGIRDKDFSVPESSADLAAVTQAFSMWLKYHETGDREAGAEEFVRTLELRTVRFWAQLYVQSESLSPRPHTWIQMEIDRERAKLEGTWKGGNTKLVAHFL